VPEFDAHLDDWLEVAGKHPWKGVLLGNGASMVLWPKFGYRTLFQVARNLPTSAALTNIDEDLFDRLEAGANFEQVLHDLAIAARVTSALDQDPAPIETRYAHIRAALIEAVNTVHVPYSRVSLTTLKRMAVYLGKHDSVFSTNYDLIVYWAMMRDSTAFTDCFLHGEVDPSLARSGRTKVYYLHGALHLYRTLHSGTRKNQNTDGADLLRLFGQPVSGEDIFPEFVSEGDANQKRAAIEQSPYLSFAFEQFESFRKPLVIFGSRLGDEDRHIVDAILQHRARPVAVSIRPSDDTWVKREKHRYAGSFANLTQPILFFDSTTHPLGDPQAFVWGESLTHTQIADQLRPVRTIVLDCPRCNRRAFVVGRRPQCWSCGYPVEPRRTMQGFIEQSLKSGTYVVLNNENQKPPFRCNQCGEDTVVNVGLKRRPWEHDPFHCFHCGAHWPPGTLRLCSRCGVNFYDARIRGAQGCSQCST
jgi:ribosomal protein L37E